MKLSLALHAVSLYSLWWSNVLQFANADGDDVDEDEDEDECDGTLTEEEKADALKFQRWAIKNFFDGWHDFLANKQAVLQPIIMGNYDTDKDGRLSLAEIDAMDEAVPELNFQYLKKYANCLTPDDGYLDLQELLKACCFGDPHFITWQGSDFNYHGACDLVLINNPSFENGLGLDLHVRTEHMLEGRFSFVSNAALRIGNDVLEVRKDSTMLLNNELLTFNKPGFVVGGFPAFRSVEEKCAKGIGHIKNCAHAVSLDVQVSPKDRITMKIFDEMVHMQFNAYGANITLAMGSRGLMGTYPGNRQGKYARDGITHITDDDNLYGQEWQVRDFEPKLFAEDRYPQFPELCIPASDKHAANQRALRFGLAEEEALRERAHVACAGVAKDRIKHKNCIFDVMATGRELSAIVYNDLF